LRQPVIPHARPPRHRAFIFYPPSLSAHLHRYSALPPPPYTCPVDVSYNNVFLITAVNLVVIGEALQVLGYGPNAAAAAASGYALLDDWFVYASENGTVTGHRHCACCACCLF
jgi:hypothetical protein